MKILSRMLYPFWSLLMGHKAMLPIIYERNPGHANLLPAYFDSGPLSGRRYIIKAAGGSQGIGSQAKADDCEPPFQ